MNNKGDIFFISENNEIVGVSSLKKSEENKICTFYIKDDYRKEGLGSKLLEQSLKYLETEKPVINFSQNKFDMFKNFVDKYNWKLTSTKSKKR